VRRILIVDDDTDMHVIYRDLFLGKKEVYELAFARSVEEAIDKLDLTDFDLVVLDIVMGPLSGQYLFLKIREDEKFKNNAMPIIVASVLEDKQLTFLKNRDNTRIFQKPLNKEEFLCAIEEMLSVQ